MVVQGGVPLSLADYDVRDYFRAVMHDLVIRLLPRTESCQHGGDIDCPCNGVVCNRNQPVATVDSGFLPGAGGRNVDGHHLIAQSGTHSINPGHPVIGQMELVLLLEIDGGGNERSYGEDHQKRADELLFKLLHPATPFLQILCKLATNTKPQLSCCRYCTLPAWARIVWTSGYDL